ncbi:MAG: SDR family oxidoreductase [Pseudomonadota bacterium]
MTESKKDLQGKVALVTGAARNMGRAFTEALAQRGANLIIHHHSESSAEEASELARRARALGVEAMVFQGDLSKVERVEALFRDGIAHFGRLDIVINNAGVVLKKSFADVTEADFDRVFGINTKAAFFVMREAARAIEDGGRIINMGTTLLGATTGMYGVYAGSKAPLEDFSRALAKEIGARGITVNTVAPGPVDTAFFHGEENEQSVAYLSQQSPLGRLGRVSDITPLIEFLVSEESAWVTAQTLFINGGFLAR